jgi:hypothetical protein
MPIVVSGLTTELKGCGHVHRLACWKTEEAECAERVPVVMPQCQHECIFRCHDVKV